MPMEIITRKTLLEKKHPYSYLFTRYQKNKITLHEYRQWTIFLKQNKVDFNHEISGQEEHA